VIAVHAAQDGARCARQPSRLEMKKLFLTGVAALAIASSTANAQLAYDPPARATPFLVTNGAPPPPPPIGWVYGPYTQCGDPPRCSMGVVNVQADGLNVRIAPDGASPAVMALVNGVPLIPMDKRGDWLLVAAGCDLTPTWAWSWTASVPLNRCWVYF